ncbi:hypothetical protein AURDEDRAFT_164128 [Auricularia subglabra TFB-10046 SS5]|nr:hypothetical protein AURDEDRAFT_164128 [Auricularia subglabra TFB-10046 SS5]
MTLLIFCLNWNNFATHDSSDANPFATDSSFASYSDLTSFVAYNLRPKPLSLEGAAFARVEQSVRPTLDMDARPLAGNAPPPPDERMEDGDEDLLDVHDAPDLSSSPSQRVARSKAASASASPLSRQDSFASTPPDSCSYILSNVGDYKKTLADAKCIVFNSLHSIAAALDRMLILALDKEHDAWSREVADLAVLVHSLVDTPNALPPPTSGSSAAQSLSAAVPGAFATAAEHDLLMNEHNNTVDLIVHMQSLISALSGRIDPWSDKWLGGARTFCLPDLAIATA